MNGSKPKKNLEEWKAQRRRERWNAFLTPLITLGSIVVSVAMLMYLIKSCGERSRRLPTVRPMPPQSAPR